MTEFFKALSDATRVKIVLQISEKECSVGGLAGLLGISQSSVSHHLQILKMNRLVKSERKGKTIFYSLSDDHVRDAITLVQEHTAEKAGKDE